MLFNGIFIGPSQETLIQPGLQGLPLIIAAQTVSIVHIVPYHRPRQLASFICFFIELAL